MNDALVKVEFPANAPSPIVDTCAGILTDVNLLEEKANAPMPVRLLEVGMVTDVRALP
jgi:hypothetical protein